jgi:lipoyl(octanoyl) transferase
VYVGAAKLASIGLRIRRGACYHGMALNVSLDPEPFERINVCGYQNMRVTRLADFGINDGLEAVANDLTPHLLRELGYEPKSRNLGYSAISTDLHAVNSR